MQANIIGATGATGRELLSQLLTDETFSQINIFVRRATGLQHDKLCEHIIDFRQPETWHNWVQGDVLFSCLGTTLKDAGSQDAQYAIDFTAQYEFAKVAKQNGVNALVLVSATGADSGSRVFYTRMKGELENAVKALNFERLIIMRPPMLIRPNTQRLGEKIALNVLNALNVVGILKSQKPLPVADLAQAMLAAFRQPENQNCVLEPRDIWAILGKSA